MLADTQYDKLKEVITECHDISIKTNNNITIEQSICDVTNKAQVQDAIRKSDELVPNDQPASILVNSAGKARLYLNTNGSSSTRTYTIKDDTKDCNETIRTSF